MAASPPRPLPAAPSDPPSKGAEHSVPPPQLQASDAVIMLPGHHQASHKPSEAAGAGAADGPGLADHNVEDAPASSPKLPGKTPSRCSLWCVNVSCACACAHDACPVHTLVGLLPGRLLEASIAQRRCRPRMKSECLHGCARLRFHEAPASASTRHQGSRFSRLLAPASFSESDGYCYRSDRYSRYDDRRLRSRDAC